MKIRYLENCRRYSFARPVLATRARFRARWRFWTKTLNLLCTWGTILSSVATGVFASSDREMIEWLHAPILPNTLGVILEEIILHKAGGVSLIVLRQRLGSTSSSHDTDQRSTGKASRLNPHVTVRKQDDTNSHSNLMPANIFMLMWQ